MRWCVTLLSVAACGGSPTTQANPPPTSGLVITPKAPEKDPLAGSDHTHADGDHADAGPVLSQIQSTYMTGLKRCYKIKLKQDPAARGKVTLNLTVSESGTTLDGKATGFAKDVDDCITDQMASWQFPVPLDRNENKTRATFSINLQLVPD